MTGTVVVAILAGGLGAKELHDAYPTVAILLVPLLVVPLLGLGLYVLVRVVANAHGSPPLRGAVMLAATCLTGFYFFALAGEAWRPLHSGDPLVRLVQAFSFLASMLGAGALAVVITGIAVWQAAGEERRNVPLGALAPLLVTVGLGAGAFALSMAILVSSLALLPRAASVYVWVGVLFALPHVLHGVWPYVYGLVLSRWEVETLSESVVRALADLQLRCGFKFDRVICLDGSYGNGRFVAVTSTIRSATLLISEPLSRLLDRHELLAILAHETAHVELRHFRRKLLFGLLATIKDPLTGLPFASNTIPLERLPMPTSNRSECCRRHPPQFPDRSPIPVSPADFPASRSTRTSAGRVSAGSDRRTSCRSFSTQPVRIHR